MQTKETREEDFYATCPHCEGSGSEIVSGSDGSAHQPCSYCDGLCVVSVEDEPEWWIEMKDKGWL